MRAIPSHERGLSRRERFAENFAKSKFGGWFAINVAHRVDKVLMPISKNKLSVFKISSPSIPVGLLTSIGAKSGKTRRTPLVFLPSGEDVVLIASKAGAAKNPAWYYNLKANPEVKFLGRQGEISYVAREAKGRERKRLWREVNDLYGGYETYQGRTGGREIPIMVLEPADRA